MTIKEEYKMNITSTKKNARTMFSLAITVAMVCLMTAAIIPGVMGTATFVDLTDASHYVIMSGSGITNTLSHGSTIIGDIGDTGTASQMDGVWCSEMSGGTIYGFDMAYTGSGTTTCFVGQPPANGVDTQFGIIQTAFTDANAQHVDVTLTPESLQGLTLAPGVYFTSGKLSLPADGWIVLDAQGVSDAVWVFQIKGDAAAGGLTTGANSRIILSNGAQAKNVFWVITGPTSLGANSVFNGNIIAGPATTQIAVITGTKVYGRLLTGKDVNLDANIVTLPTDPSVHSGPLVTSVTPAAGPLAGLNTVVIHGTGLTGATSVTFDGKEVVPGFSGDDLSITAQIPANTTLTGPTDPVDVVVTTPVGTGTGIGLYTYANPPVFDRAETNAAGNVFIVTFDKDMMLDPTGTFGDFRYKINGAGSDLTFSAAAYNATTPTNIDLTPFGSYIAPGDVINISYTAGTVTAADAGILASFAYQDVLAPFAYHDVVNNMPKPPEFFSAETNSIGNVIIITFDKGMMDPTGNAGAFRYQNATGSHVFSAIALNITDITNTRIDLTTITPVVYGDLVNVSYTPGSITAMDGSILAGFSFADRKEVTNNVPAAMVPPEFFSAETNTAGNVIIVTFDKGMMDPTGNAGAFRYQNATGSHVFSTIALNTTDITNTRIDLTTNTPVVYGDLVNVSYTPGSITAMDGSILAGFSFADRKEVTNNVPADMPTVIHISPATGSTSGGTLVTITGTAFTGATEATFDSTSVTVTNVTSNSLTARAPAHAAGTVDITVTTAGGTSTTSMVDLYTYVIPVPTFTSISPVTGSTSGGTLVTITGTGLTAATEVTFNNTVATSVTVINDNSITAIAPPTTNGNGIVTVKVTTPGGIATKTDAYTYVILIQAVDLKSAINYVILAKTGISTTGTTSIVGDIGVSPIFATAMTGFGLIADASNQFSTSSLLTGKAYAADYAVPTPATMSTAISDMETAYASAAGRTLPDATELYAGDLGGKTLTPGLYKWSTGVLIPASTTLTLDGQGNADSVWIFQISGDLTMNSASQVVLTNGAKAENVYWQVGGPTSVALRTGAHCEGTILTAKAITMESGATLNGRAFAQTAVTLIANRINSPIPVIIPAADQGASNGDSYGGTVSGGAASSPSGVSGLLAPVVPSSTTVLNGAGPLTSKPFVVDITGMPGVSVSWLTQIDNNPSPNTRFTTVVLPSGDPLSRDSVSTALRLGGLDIGSMAYGMFVQTNGISTSGPTTVSMTVSPEWVTQNGGNNAIRIVRIATDGTPEVLHTWVDGVDPSSSYQIFKATSSRGGLGTFWLVSVIPYTPATIVPAVQEAPAPAAPVSGQLAPAQTLADAKTQTPSTDSLWPVLGVGGALAALAIIGIALVTYLRRNKGKN